MLREIPVFSAWTLRRLWGYSEETKPMLMTTHGFIPWDDSHHVEAVADRRHPDGKWCSSTATTRRVSPLIDLGTFRTGKHHRDPK
jgi:nitrous-oxide reductase